VTFKEWIATLTPERKHTTGEDVADSVGLMVIMALLLFVVFI
jgi:hypothetical protein